MSKLRFRDERGNEYPQWKEFRIDELGEIVTGSTPSKSNNLFWEEGNRLWVSPSDMGDFVYITDTRNKLAESGLSKARILPAGSVLVTCIGSTIGKMGILKEPGASNQQINSVIPGSEFHSEFVYYIISKQKNLLVSAAGNTAVPILNKTQFSKIKVSSPTLPEQKKIAAFLSALDENIDLHRRKLELLRKQKAGYMQKIFSRELRFKDDEGNDYPEWENIRLGDVAEIVMGQSPNGSAYSNNPENGVLLIQGNADLRNGNVLPRTYTSHITKRGQPGDILFTVRAPVGEIAFLETTACLGRGVCSIRTDNRLIKCYLEYLKNKNYWTAISQGSTFEAVNGKEISNTPIIQPLSEQERASIISILESFDMKISLSEEKLSACIKNKLAYQNSLFG